MASFKSEPSTFSCAVGYFSSVSPLSVSIMNVSSGAQRHLAGASVSTVVQFALTFDIEPYAFSTPLAAYEAVNLSLSNAVYGGSFTKLINAMSEVYSPPVYSDTIFVYPFSATVTAQPSPLQQQLSIDVAGASGTSVDITMVACIVGGLLLLLAGGTFFCLSRRREAHQDEKNLALNNVISSSLRDRGVQPVPEDNTQCASASPAVAEVGESENMWTGMRGDVEESMKRYSIRLVKTRVKDEFIL